MCFILFFVSYAHATTAQGIAKIPQNIPQNIDSQNVKNPLEDSKLSPSNQADVRISQPQTQPTPPPIQPSIDTLPDIVSHEAQYSVEFVPSKEAKKSGEFDSEYVGAKGVMTLQMVRFENHWITKQTSTLRLDEGENGQSGEMTSTTLNTLEEHDGTKYEFSAEAMRDSEVEEEIQGHARLISVGGPGIAIYEKPEPMEGDEKETKLPHSTVFPITHLKMLLKKAMEIKGKNLQLVKTYVFDGSNDVRDAVRISAMIVPVGTKDREILSSDKTVYHVEKLWRADMSVFTKDNKSDIPDYTMTQFFSDQGVIHEIRMNYGDYEMVSKITKLKVYTKDEAARTLRLVSSRS